MRTARAKGLRRAPGHHAPRPAQRHAPGRHPHRHRLRHRRSASAILTETVFNWPGLGSEIAQAASARDLPVLLGLTLVVVLVYGLVNLAVDMSLRLVRPAHPTGGRGRAVSEPIDPETGQPGEDPAIDPLSTRSRPPSPAPGCARGRAVRHERRAHRDPPRPLVPPGRLAAVPQEPPGHVRPRPRALPAGGRADRARSSSRTRSTQERLIFKSLARCHPLVRHRQHRPRRVHPRRLRHPAVAAHRVHRGGARDVHRHHPGRARRLVGGGLTDSFIMRFIDIFLAIPYIVLAFAFVTVIGEGVNAVILVLALTGWLTTARIVRASFLQAKQLEYVEAARALGVPATPDHVPPHPAQRAPADHRATARSASAARSWPRRRCRFLGVGVAGPRRRRWGLMVSEAQSYFATAPHLLFFPGMAIFLTVLGVRVRRRRPARRTRPEAEVTDDVHRTRSSCRSADLSVHFDTDDGDVHAVDGVSLRHPPRRGVRRRGRVGLGQVGDGHDASWACSPPLDGRRAARSSGRARTCSTASDEECAQVRGGEIAMIFQDPLTALNPVHTVGRQIARDGARSTRSIVQAGRPASGRSRCSTWSASPQAAQAGRHVPARVLRRHAPAGHDRHGHHLQARPAHRRRADHRARRDRAGPGARGAARRSRTRSTRRSC